MASLLAPLSIASILFSGAIFGFFYAWVCSTMWGLDTADPRVAIAAMQAMNAQVRNIVFFPAFFLTPLVLLATSGAAYFSRYPRAAGWFAAGAVTYFFFGLVLTTTINVPMNEQLALQVIPEEVGAAERMWREYSGPWQFWNLMRTLASGLALALVATGTLSLGHSRAHTA